MRRRARSRLLHHRGVPGTAVLRLGGDLSRFVPARRRGSEVRVTLDGTSTLGHLVESTGVPLPEVGTLRVSGTPVAPSHRPADGSTVDVAPVHRPQPLPITPPRFLLDVHLGRLARRMRVLGLDTEYDTDAHDADLAERAATDARILLTRDLGLLRRRAVPHAAYVRGARTAEQLADVLDRFAPPLDPYTRCTACNGELCPVRKDDVADRLRPGTRRTYEEFSRCDRCGQVYWRGAHARALDAVVRTAGAARGPGPA
jgi:uncharacterized protein